MTLVSTVTLSELADVLTGLEKAITWLVTRRHPDGDKKFFLGLINIVDKSATLELVSSHPIEAGEAVNELTGAVRANAVHSYPKPVREGIDQAVKFAKSRPGGTVELSLIGQPDNAAAITPDLEIEMKTPSVKGETVIYGMVTRVGGKKPVIRLALDSGEEMSCETTAPLAREVAPRLYETAALEGTAEWDPSDWSVISFTPKRLLPYVQGPLTDAFKALSEAAGPDAWSDVDDVVAALAELRRGS